MPLNSSLKCLQMWFSSRKGDTGKRGSTEWNSDISLQESKMYLKYAGIHN